MASVHVPWEKRVTQEQKTVHAKLMKDYRRANHEKYLERERRSKLKVPDFFRKQRAFKYNLYHQYGITPENYYYMLYVQNGVCAICSGHNDKNEDARLHVDHDHNTGVIRGLLCHRCNQGMIAVDAYEFFCDAAQRYKGGVPSRSQE